MTELEQLEETKISSVKVYEGCLLHVYHDEVKLPNGATGQREHILHNGAVAIVPLTDDNQVYIERQYRYPVHEVLTEIPAGKLDYIGENKLDAAKRELREETGITANKWTFLGDLIPTCAYSNEKIAIYLAQDLTLGERDLDEDEFLNIKKVPLQDLVDQIMEGKIQDSKTQTALLKTYLYINR